MGGVSRSHICLKGADLVGVSPLSSIRWGVGNEGCRINIHCPRICYWNDNLVSSYLGIVFFEDWVLGWRLGQKCRFEICRVLGWETWAKYVFWNCLAPQMKSMKQPDISVILYKINENSKGWAPSILVISRVPCVHLLRKLYQAFRHGGAPHVIVLVGRLVNNSHQKGAALNFSPVDIKYKL